MLSNRSFIKEGLSPAYLQLLTTITCYLFSTGRHGSINFAEKVFFQKSEHIKPSESNYFTAAEFKDPRPILPDNGATGEKLKDKLIPRIKGYCYICAISAKINDFRYGDDNCKSDQAII